MEQVDRLPFVASASPYRLAMIKATSRIYMTIPSQRREACYSGGTMKKCTDCGETVDHDDGGPSHSDYNGSPGDRLDALVERIEALEASPRVAVMYRASVATNLDGMGPPDAIGYSADKTIAMASVRGKAMYGCDGDVLPVWAIVDADGNVFEVQVQPSRGGLIV